MDTDPGGTLKRFKEYVDQMKLLHQLVFRKADGTPYDPTDSEKKALMLLKGGKDMKNLYDHAGKVLAADTFDNQLRKLQVDCHLAQIKLFKGTCYSQGFRQVPNHSNDGIRRLVKLQS